MSFFFETAQIGTGNFSINLEIVTSDFTNINFYFDIYSQFQVITISNDKVLRSGHRCNVRHAHGEVSDWNVPDINMQASTPDPNNEGSYCPQPLPDIGPSVTSFSRTDQFLSQAC